MLCDTFVCQHAINLSRLSSLLCIFVHFVVLFVALFNVNMFLGCDCCFPTGKVCNSHKHSLFFITLPHGLKAMMCAGSNAVGLSEVGLWVKLVGSRLPSLPLYVE